MPETCPSNQLFGNALGQNGSTWNCGTAAAGFSLCACAAPAVSAVSTTPRHIVVVFLIVSSRVCSLQVLDQSGWLRHSFLSSRVEREDPGAVEEWRRRHLAI